MICSTCIKTPPIPLCVDSIVIGQITDASTAVIVRVRNEATKRIDEFTTTSGADMKVSIDTEDFEFMENHYTFQIIRGSDRTPYDITIGGETAECVDVSFEQCNENVVSIELQLA